MPVTVRELIEGHQEPVIVPPTGLIRDALHLMIERDFSQLPVVDSEGKPLGMVTAESVVRALHNFGLTTERLRVAEALVTARPYRAEDDLFEVLTVLRDTYAVLITDRAGKLTGIVTAYDAAEYFQRRAQDMMLAEDIEGAIKDSIRAAFLRSPGETDEEALAGAIAETTDRTRELRNRFRRAVEHYLRLQTDAPAVVQKVWLDEAFSHLTTDTASTPFEDLALGDYIGLVLSRPVWVRLGTAFGVERDALGRLLDGVRKTRNDLAHFRPVDPVQSEQLRFCAQWLSRVELPQHVQAHDSEVPGLQEEMATRPEEALGPDESRYAPLAVWLQQLPADQQGVSMTFNEVEGIIGDALPPSARQHRSWWANDSVTHVQSQQWLGVGWRVSEVSLAAGRATFTRIAGRRPAYMRFFGALLAASRRSGTFPVRPANPDGQSWVTVASLPESGLSCADLYFGFTRSGRFRVEAYVDTGDLPRNKAVFDQLHAGRAMIEASVGEPLSWERLDTKRASRIALYRTGSITDSDQDLDVLRDWAIGAMACLYGALKDPLRQAIDALEVPGAQST